ncbi:MAG: hypothetical protein MK066_11315, partial [Crocinitomicaceae bacterium]|nr:hypothetical protein [Crocinitomicaceae bacterium]
NIENGNSGNVGIGNNNPQHKLDVNGNANFRGDILVDNFKPMIKKRYTFGRHRYRENDNQYPPSHYEAIIAGLQFKHMTSGGYADEHFMAYIEPDGLNWVIDVRFPDGGGGQGGNNKTKIIDVLFIRKELIREDNSVKNYP